MGIAFNFVAKWRGCPYRTEDLPSFAEFVIHALVAFTFTEIGFYYTHRLAHHPLVYKRVHKMHHEWTAPIAIMAVYCHWMEQAFVHMFPTLIGPALMGSHTIVNWFVWFVVQSYALTAHSGYHLPFMFSNESHDYHHSKG